MGWSRPSSASSRGSTLPSSLAELLRSRSRDSRGDPGGADDLDHPLALLGCESIRDMVPNRDDHLGGSEQPGAPASCGCARRRRLAGERFPDAARRGHELSLCARRQGAIGRPHFRGEADGQFCRCDDKQRTDLTTNSRRSARATTGARWRSSSSITRKPSNSMLFQSTVSWRVTDNTIWDQAGPATTNCPPSSIGRARHL